MESAGDPVQAFLIRLDAVIRDGTFVRLTLGKPRGGDETLRKVQVRPVDLRQGGRLSFLWRHDRRDITRNLDADESLAEVGRLLGSQFGSAHLDAGGHALQLEFNRKGEPRLTGGRGSKAAPDRSHDRAKQRLLPPSSACWLRELGVLSEQGGIREGMADKHRQIHRFVEILSHLARGLPVGAASKHPIAIADMGCGKGYLTFATHDYFNLVAGRPADVRGREQRPELVELGNRIASQCGVARLAFETGAIADFRPERLDVLIALHACDTATDDALARGVAAKATLLVVAPCCQKELRPQLDPAPVLAPALRHGIFRERQTEFVTDALRALLLDWAGYETKVFEFISTEHTARNTMIAATRRPDAGGRNAAAAPAIREFASFYGICRQSLAAQLGFDLS